MLNVFRINIFRLSFLLLLSSTGVFYSSPVRANCDKNFDQLLTTYGRCPNTVAVASDQCMHKFWYLCAQRATGMNNNFTYEQMAQICGGAGKIWAGQFNPSGGAGGCNGKSFTQAQQSYCNGKTGDPLCPNRQTEPTRTATEDPKNDTGNVTSNTDCSLAANQQKPECAKKPADTVVVDPASRQKEEEARRVREAEEKRQKEELARKEQEDARRAQEQARIEQEAAKIPNPTSSSSPGDTAQTSEYCKKNPTAAACRANEKEEVNRIVDRAKYAASNKERFTPEANSTDDCPVSATVDGKFTCAGTKTLIDGAKIANVASQTIGSAVVQYQGSAAVQNAAKQGTQSASLEAAAELQANSAKMQMGTGAMNLALGLIQYQKSSQHEKNAKELKAATQKAQYNSTISKLEGTSDIGTNAITGQGIDTHHSAQLSALKKLEAIAANSPDPQTRATAAAQAEEIKATLNTTASQDLRRVGNTAAGEQMGVKEQASAGAMLSLITGAQQAAGGYFNKKAADELKAAAAKLKQAENYKPPGIAGVLPGFTPNYGNNGTVTGRQLQPLNDGTATPQSSAAESDKEDDSAPGLTLGNPGNPNPFKDDIATGPAPGPLMPNSNGGPGGAPGGGGLPGGGTAPAQGEGDPNSKGQYLDRRPASDSYGNGGAYAPGSIGSNSGGSGGPDLSKLLAQFLPKSEDDKLQNGILDFGGKGPNGEAPFSVLDKNADIFKRIHETYQEKQQGGSVGF